MAQGGPKIISLSACIVDVENAVAVLKAAAMVDPSLEGAAGKKLAAAVELILPKDGVTKVLNQAYGYAEKKWAINALSDKDTDGCTKENKLEKIKQYVLKSDGYDRFSKVEKTNIKVQQWLVEKFNVATTAAPVPAESAADSEEEKAA